MGGDLRELFCWHCSKKLCDLPQKIGFREICPYCHSYLHCCKNCENHQEGLPNQCKIPGTDPVREREGVNFCEEFIILGKKQAQKVDLDALANKLFKKP